MKKSDIAISALILAVIMIIIIPLPTWMLDALLIMSITISLFIMLSALFIKRPLEFSVLPTLLLITTLFRLALNLSSTKLILGNGGDAGEVIATFGSFVIGGNLVVGIVAFLIIVAIQFVVITKGAERVSEVAARFTLDAMPGKQMSIDADLNTGAIDEIQAKERRSEIQREADFYGAMDGASKFIKGDAIISIIITIVNIVGGLIIGLTMEGMEIGTAVSVYTLATVGDGLVSQIPALLISTSTGIVVTRSASDGSFGTDMSKQLLQNPNIMIMCGVILLILCLVPGFPKPQILFIAAVLLVSGYLMRSRVKKAEKPVEKDQDKTAAEEKRKPENVLSLLQVEQLELEFGYGIVPLVDKSQGGDLLENFVKEICACVGDWTAGNFIEETVARIQAQVGQDGHVICGLSGGVDSAVAAALVHRAIGDRLACVFVDHGLLRQGEPEQVVETFQQHQGMHLIAVDAKEEFLTDLVGVTDPERKRKLIGARFVRVFEAEAARLALTWGGDVPAFLAQGTLYPDVIESAGSDETRNARTIKTHHNVGGLPADMTFQLIEPLRMLFKDEVRSVGEALGLPEEIVWRPPFPGPGLAIRMVGEVTWERLETLRHADTIFLGELRAAGLYRSTSQVFGVLLPIRSVGVMGDGRTYGNVLALRAVTTDDFMTADWARLPYDLLARISSRIVNEVDGVTRVVYDISSKPPATIEWE